METPPAWMQLDAAEQRVLIRLGVFCGEFDRIAAQEVAECSLDQLFILLDRSLLRCGLMGTHGETQRSAPGRYELAADMRLSLQEQLARDPAEETIVRQRHAEWFADVAQRLYPDMRGQRQSRAYAIFADYVNDVRAAWGWAVARQDLNLLFKIPAALISYYNMRGRFSESLNALESVLPQEDSELPYPPALAAHLIGLYSEILVETDRYEKAKPWVERGLNLARLGGEAPQIAAILNIHARILWVNGDTNGAAETWQEVQEIARRCADLPVYLDSLNGLGKVYWARGEHPKALEYFRTSLQVAQELRAPVFIGLARDFMGVVYRELHEYETSRGYLMEAVAILRESGAKIRLAYALNHLAGVLGYLGEIDQEMQIFAESLALARDTGERRLEAYILSDMSDTLSNSGELSKAFELKRSAHVVFKEVGDHLGQMVALNGMANIRLKACENQPASADLLAEARTYIRQALEMAISGNTLLHISSVLLTGIGVIHRSGLVVQAIQGLTALQLVLDGSEAGEEKSLAEEVEDEFLRLSAGLPPAVLQAAQQMGRELTSVEDVARLILKNL